MQLLKKALPSFVSPLVDYFIVNAGGLDVARELGIGAFRCENVVRRFDLLCEVKLLFGFWPRRWHCGVTGVYYFRDDYTMYPRAGPGGHQADYTMYPGPL